MTKKINSSLSNYEGDEILVEDLNPIPTSKEDAFIQAKKALQIGNYNEVFRLREFYADIIEIYENPHNIQLFYEQQIDFYKKNYRLQEGYAMLDSLLYVVQCLNIFVKNVSSQNISPNL